MCNNTEARIPFAAETWIQVYVPLKFKVIAYFERGKKNILGR